MEFDYCASLPQNNNDQTSFCGRIKIDLMKTIPVRHISNTPRDPAFSATFGMLDIELYLAGQDRVQPLHRHDFFYVLVLERGAGIHHIDFVDYPVIDNTVFFLRPGQVHELTLKKECSGYLLKFSSDFYTPLDASLKRIFRKVSNNNLYRFNADHMKTLSAVLSNIYQESRQQQDMHSNVIKSYLDIFFMQLLRGIEQAERSADQSDYIQERLHELQELLVCSAANHKQVSFYAHTLHLTTYQINAITKATLGKTCSEVINDHIILEAKRHLLATSSQVNQIAGYLGYEDVSYFVRFFKKNTGYSPEAFRKGYK